VGGLVLWGRVQRVKEFNGWAGEKVRYILLSFVLSAVLLFALFILLSPATLPAQAQGGYSPWRTFNIGNSGLTDNFVEAILQDREGNLWFGTEGGVSRYDGHPARQRRQPLVRYIIWGRKPLQRGQLAELHHREQRPGGHLCSGHPPRQRRQPLVQYLWWRGKTLRRGQLADLQH